MTPTQESNRFRWKKWGAVAAGLLAVYAAIGYWLVPLIISSQIPRYALSRLARQASVGQVKFDPFTLRMTAADLRLAEADGAPLLAIGKLTVELQWRSLVRRAWSFAQIRVTAPSADLVIAPDGKFNFAELLATFAKQPHEASPDADIPRLVVEQFALEQGRVELQDRRAGYANVVAPIDFSLAHFSTLPNENDAHTLSAQLARGGKLQWKGQATVNPIRGSGELTLEDASLPELSVYLKSQTRAQVAAGWLSASLPYTFSYSDGRFGATLAGAKVSLRDLALAREGATDSFAALTRLDVNDVNADLAQRKATVGEVRADGGKLTVRRDARGELDLANLTRASAGPAAALPAGAEVVVNDWKVAVKQVLVDKLAVAAVDETVSPPLRLEVGRVHVQLQADAAQSGADLQVKLSQMAVSATDLALTSGAQMPLKIGELGFTDGSFDLSGRRVVVGRLFAQSGQIELTRDAKGELSILGLLPKPGEKAPSATKPSPPWVAVARQVELARFGADVQDQVTGIKLRVDDIAARLTDAGSDLRQPVQFDASLKLRQGGELSAHGNVVPETGALQADLRVQQLSLLPLQPLLASFVKLKIGSGQVAASGRITRGAGAGKNSSLSYVGSAGIANLKLDEQNGDLFAAWREVRADKFTATLQPARIDIPELRIVEANAKLIIEDDRSFNAARLLVQPAGAATKSGAPPARSAETPDDEPIAVRIRRVRLLNAKLDFTDLSLRPQFTAKIYELNGVVNGLSSNRQSRSQIELDGRVDEFGSARIRGELNPFAPANNTDVNVVFKNVDLVPTSPYSMKFAGYRIAEGKISLDLQYKVRNSQLEGVNQIVIDKLTLGERVESPDAFKLPLELAIALLKDSDGRIDLGLPVSGNLSDPQFSYGALIWKAIGNLLTRIVTAPFRAIGALLGIGGEKLESIDFDSGSASLLPPERDKLKQVAQLLGKRPQLKLSVPGQYSEAADGAALRARLVRVEIARRVGVKLEASEEPGPVDFGNRAVRSALRELYAARFGDAELDKQKKAAEAAVTAPAVAASTAADLKSESAQAKLPIWQRVGKMIQGEPQVADSGAFYNNLLERLNQNQPLAPDALAQLGTQRADAIVAALKDSGIDSTRAVAAAPEKGNSEIGKPVPVKLTLTAK